MSMKKIGFLSFGHWTPSPQSQTRSASDALLQSIDLAVAAEKLGADGAYFRVHHFARQLGSPFPLLAAVGAKTRSSICGTRTLCTWQRTLVRPTSSPADDSNWASAAVRPNR
jgi:alkanesulfonate monooxygenase SsuD/methylene tetrahydromethanopterin reductase-like flavin-dependent oxidoreductase (luciferase family)